MTAQINFSPDRFPSQIAPKGAPLGFDDNVYEEVQASLDSIRAQIQTLQDKAEGLAIRKKAFEERQKVKDAYMAKEEAKRQETLRNVDEVFEDYNKGFVADFRTYKDEPPAVLPTSLKPEVQAGFSSGTQKPVSFESKWVEQKAVKEHEPKKQGLFGRLWNKVTGKTETRMPAPHDSLNQVQQAHINTQKEKTMPHWAQVALSKAKEIDASVLQKVKDQARGWKDVPPPPSTPSYALPRQQTQPQQEQQQPKKSFFSRVSTGAVNIASRVASWF
jgi:hypothetical protein